MDKDDSQSIASFARLSNQSKIYKQQPRQRRIKFSKAGRGRHHTASLGSPTGLESEIIRATRRRAEEREKVIRIGISSSAYGVSIVIISGFLEEIGGAPPKVREKAPTDDGRPLICPSI